MSTLPNLSSRRICPGTLRACSALVGAGIGTTASAFVLGSEPVAVAAIVSALSAGAAVLVRLSYERLTMPRAGQEAPAAASTPEAAANPSAPALAATLAQRKLDELTQEVERLRAGEAELLAAKAEADSAALAKGEFLATMSHEIRSPLNGILPILELVLGAKLEEEVRRQVEAALESAREMRRIVNDVLDYSKLDSGAMQLECASLRPADLANGVCTLMRRAAENKQLALSCRIDASVPPVLRGDALRLRQVLTNLVGNAVKFTQHGEVRIEVSQAGEDRSHRFLHVEVVDTGAGIAPEFAANLFQPFSQADASMARKHGGTGLGLAICRRIIDAMGGRIGVRSAVGRGSTFWFTVPLLRAAGEAGATTGEELQAVLLTRDEALADAWSRNLAAMEIRCTRVNTAFEVLSTLRAAAETQGPKGVPPLILIDLASAARTAASIVRPVLSQECFSETRLLLIGDSHGGLVDDTEARAVLASPDMPEASVHQMIKRLLPQRFGKSPLAADAPVVELSNDPVGRFDGLKVLLVDDIPINRYAGQRVLERLGAVVTQAPGGREAIEIARRDEFDVVLMDCQMPDIDGYTATRVLRLHERTASRRPIPILAVTANAMPGDRERSLEAGMDDHLAKPIGIGPLSRLLAKWTGPQATPVAGSAAPRATVCAADDASAMEPTGPRNEKALSDKVDGTRGLQTAAIA